MGAWCGVGSRPDLRHRPRHRCAVATPASPAFPVTGYRRRPVRDRRRDVGQPADWANDVDDVGLRRPATNQRRQLPTCRSSLVAARSQRVPRHGEHEPPGVGHGDVATAASHPRRQRPVAPVLGRRDAWAGEHDVRGTACRRPIARWLSSLANSGSTGSRVLISYYKVYYKLTVTRNKLFVSNVLSKLFSTLVHWKIILVENRRTEFSGWSYQNSLQCNKIFV